MIDLNHQYALLEDGTIEELFYGFNGEPRDKYEENGKYYLDHDRWEGTVQFLHHSEILATANNKPWLEQHRREILDERRKHPSHS